MTIYSHHDRSHPGTINPSLRLADRQDYDLLEVVKQIDDPASFDLICVSSGANENNQPRNLEAFQCPKVLLVGDTHHIHANPLRFVMDYLLQETYDKLVSMHNRDHMKWMRQVGDVQPGWFPGLTAQDIRFPFQWQRASHVSFVGSWRVSHPRRKNFIQKITRDGIPFDHRKLSRSASAEHYAKSLIAFNCSLNGDLNMRVHEILSAGGFLLTDKLAKQSGLDDMLEEGKEYVSYSSYRDFRDKARFFIAHPQEAIEIAGRGFTTFQKSLSPEVTAKRFLNWATGVTTGDGDYNDRLDEVAGVSMTDRLAAYEFAQSKQLWQENTRVLAIGRRAAQTAGDFSGLARVNVSFLTTSNSPDVSLEKPVTVEEASNIEWSMVITDRGELPIASAMRVAKNGLFVF